MRWIYNYPNHKFSFTYNTCVGSYLFYF